MTISATETPAGDNFISPTQSCRRRRGPVNLGAAGSPRALLLSVNDDEKERRNRRKSLHLTNVIQSPNGSVTPALKQSGLLRERDGLVSAGRTRVGMTNAQLTEHYSNCIKLSSENKINAKNAFGLHLIDYMKDLLKEAQNDDDTTNFQVASCTLDAGVKIYAGRVDSVHTDACRMLENLGKKKNANNDKEGINDGDGSPAKKQEERKKKKNTGKTIESNLKNINCENYDFAFEVDPFFCKTSAEFDEGGTSGLMLNHLRVKDDYSELLLDSDCVPYYVKSPPLATAAANFADLSNFQDLLKKLQQDDIKICPEFSSFRFTGWNGSSETFSELRSDNTHRFDTEAPVDVNANDDYDRAYNEDAGYQFDDDDDSPGAFDGQNMMTLSRQLHDSLTIKDGKEAKLINSEYTRSDGLTSSREGTLCLELSSQPSEYSYFNNAVLRTWAGPDYWKLRNLVRGNQSKSEIVKKSTQKKEPFRINYKEEKDFYKHFTLSKASTTLAASTIERQNVENTTFPEDLHYATDDLFRLFLKRSVKVKRKFQAVQLNDDDNAWYNYDNANDRNNFCPELEMGDGDYDDDDVGGTDITCAFPDISGDTTHLSDNRAKDASCFSGDNLVPAPKKVEKIEIGYAKTAKRIDVRKLKKGIWSLLTYAESTENKENVPQNAESQLHTEVETAVTGWHSFQNVYKDLPSKLSSNANKSLSVPIAFVCLLYLANEKGLRIEGKENLDDLAVTQETSLIGF